jgi:hypothetical protein
LIQRLNISAPAERQGTYFSVFAHTSRDAAGFLIRQIISATITIIRACEKEFIGIDWGETGIIDVQAFETPIHRLREHFRQKLRIEKYPRDGPLNLKLALQLTRDPSAVNIQ